MGRDSELFKAAKTGNNAVLERVFASYLRRANPQASSGGGGGSSGGGGGHFGSIRHKTHPNIQDDSGYTLLHHATLQGQKDTVSLLLKCGASTTITDSSGSCCLHLAAWRGDLEIVRILVSQGPSRANVNQLNDQEDSALHLASQYGYSDIVEFLLQRHADPLQRNIKGETPLDLAAQYGHLDTVHLLISNAPEILHLQRADFSPLHLAARNGHTVVALSLINAGICVNTVCERGSALHEAAMCGKSDMVQLLLDKGVDIDLKDSSGKTVMDFLQDYNAPRANDIKKIIQDHVTSKSQRAGSSPPPQPEGAYRVIAVAKTNVNAVMEEGSALAFKKGDNIVVQGRAGPDVFVGTAHGRTGSFLVQDAAFYKEKGGVLVETDHTHLFNDVVTPVGSLATGQPPEGAMRMTITNRAPYEEIPGFPSPSPSDSVAMATANQPRPLSTLVSSSSSSGHHQQRQQSAIFDSSISVEVAESLSRTWSEPYAKDSAAKLLGKGNRLSQLSQRSETRRLSKKEKKFQLSKDDGSYAELKPVDPHDAKKEFGNTLKLNPVGPAFQQAAASTATGRQGGAEQGAGLGGDGDHVTTAHNVVESEDKNKPQFQGSYYVLEVGNFDPIGETPVVSPPTSGDDVTTPTPLQPGYYMLDLQNFDGEEESGEGTKVEAEPKYSNVRYENITPAGSVGSKVSTSPEARLSPEYRTSAESATSEAPPTTSGSNDNIQKATVYENVIISALGVPEPVMPAEHPYNVPPPKATLNTTGAEPPRPPRGDGRGFSAVPVEDESGYTLIDETSKKLGVGGVIVSTRLPDCYEEHKFNASQSDSQGHVIQGQGHVTPEETSPTKRSARKRREEVYEAINVSKADGGRKPRPQHIATPQMNGTSESNRTQSSGETTTSRIIDNSQGDPFAGLILSASRQLEDSLPPGPPQLLPGATSLGVPAVGGAPAGGGGVVPEAAAGGFRRRVDTIWDDVRVQKEWTQIDTLLRDISLPEGAPLSPTHSNGNSPVKQAQQSADIYQWLKGHGLSGYASVLESSGFDCKEFLNGGILAMDDLVDIGITEEGDRYNLMAAVSLLPDPPKVGHAHTVSDWLHLLNLPYLEEKFRGYSLKRVSNFWDIELASVVGIELLGYRKRLQYGISELRRTHPQWAERSTSGQLPSGVPKIPTKKRKATPTIPVGPTHAQLLREDGTELVVRSPSEAMLASGGGVSSVGGGVGGVASSPGGGRMMTRVSSETWKHPNSALTDGCNYRIKYLGSLVAKKVLGQQSAEEACLKLRHSMGGNTSKIPEIILSISWKGVQFADATTKNVISTHAIRDISYCSADREDKCVFAYITKDRQANINYSHVFMAPSKEIAEEIRMTIGQAFEICYQKVMKAKRLSQEKRTSGTSPIASPVH